MINLIRKLKTKKIIIEKINNIWIANCGKAWDKGRSPSSAIGNLMMNHRELFGVSLIRMIRGNKKEEL